MAAAVVAACKDSAFGNRFVDVHMRRLRIVESAIGVRHMGLVALRVSGFAGRTDFRDRRRGKRRIAGMDDPRNRGLRCSLLGGWALGLRAWALSAHALGRLSQVPYRHYDLGGLSSMEQCPSSASQVKHPR